MSEPHEIIWARYKLEREADEARQHLSELRYAVNQGMPLSGHVKYQLEQLVTEAGELLDKRIKPNEAR